MWIAQRLNSNWLPDEVFLLFLFFFFLSFDIIEIDLGFRCGLYEGWTRTGCLVRSPETGSPRGRWANPPKGAKENVREKPFFGLTSFKEALSFVPLLMRMIDENGLIHIFTYWHMLVLQSRVSIFHSRSRSLYNVKCKRYIRRLYSNFPLQAFHYYSKILNIGPWLLSAECFQI